MPARKGGTMVEALDVEVGGGHGENPSFVELLVSDISVTLSSFRSV